jgi:hypothetical protein
MQTIIARMDGNLWFDAVGLALVVLVVALA